MAFFVLLLAGATPGQVCRLSVAGLNQARRVMGPVGAECPAPFVPHTSPFGNWGVTSNFGPKLDGHQFDGWCHNSLICDNSGNCRTNCRDGWYEWNSCTGNPLYKAPNCTLYNDANCTAQSSPTGINVLGTQTVDVRVRCPIDTDGDGAADEGGCRDVGTYSHGTNFMSIYELDPGSPDELVQSIYFPETPVRPDCGVLGCPQTVSEFVAPSFYQSPVSPPKVYAEMATILNFGVFSDGDACRYTPPRVRLRNAASYVEGALAPGAIASAFGDTLSTVTAQAASLPPPSTLAGTSVRLTDAAGIPRSAALFFVSPRQVNFEVPAATLPGAATVVIRTATNVTSTVQVTVSRTAPGVFAASAGGSGQAAATAVRVRADNSVEALLPGSIDLGADSDRVYLSLYATGLRFASAVAVSIGGIACEVTYAGAQGQYAGLDQVNVLLPRALRGRGTVAVAVAADGRDANPVTITVQ